MKLNFNFPLTDLNSKVIRENIGQILAHELVVTAKGDPLKHFEWAKDLHAGKVIDLDKSDTLYLKNFVKDCQNIAILAKAPMLEVFEEKPTSGTGKKTS